MKIRGNKRFKCFLAKKVFLFSGFSEDNKTKCLHLHLLYLDSNKFRISNRKISEPIKPNKNSNFLYL